MAGTLKHVRGQFFRSRFAGTARDRHHGFSPGGVNAMREPLQCRDRILNQQQTILHTLEVGVAADMIRARDRRDGAALKRIRDKTMRIDKLTIKTGAGVVLLRERKEELARAYRTRVNGIIFYLFVKHLGADARRIRAHQSCCLANLHVITASSCSSCEGVLAAGSSKHSTNRESELWLIETFAKTSAKLRPAAGHTSPLDPCFGG